MTMQLLLLLAVRFSYRMLLILMCFLEITFEFFFGFYIKVCHMALRLHTDSY